MSGSADTENTESSQPEEFPFENFIADFADVFWEQRTMGFPGKGDIGAYKKLLWVLPNTLSLIHI